MEPATRERPPAWPGLPRPPLAEREPLPKSQATQDWTPRAPNLPAKTPNLPAASPPAPLQLHEPLTRAPGERKALSQGHHL